MSHGGSTSSSSAPVVSSGADNAFQPGAAPFQISGGASPTGGVGKGGNLASMGQGMGGLPGATPANAAQPADPIKTMAPLPTIQNNQAELLNMLTNMIGQRNGR